MLLAMHSIEDEIVDMRLQAALAGNQLTRIDNVLVARSISDLTARSAALLAAGGDAARPAAEGGEGAMEVEGAGGVTPVLTNQLAA